MKKRVILGTILPVFAAVAVIGSGYAVWHFNDTARTTNTNMDFDITNVIQGANLEADFDALKLTFDQSTAKRDEVNSSEASNIGHSIESNGNTTATGIKLTATENDSKVTDPKVSYKNITTEGVSSYATPEAENPTIGQVFTVTLSMPTTVANYITITLDTSTATGWKETTTKDSASTSGTTTWVWTNTTYGEVTWKWSYVSFAYNTTDASKEPTKISEYASLSSALSSATGAKAVYEAYRWAK